MEVQIFHQKQGCQGENRLGTGPFVKKFAHFWIRTMEGHITMYNLYIPRVVRRNSRHRPTQEDGQIPIPVPIRNPTLAPTPTPAEIIRPHTQFQSTNWYNRCATVGSYICSAGGYEFAPLPPFVYVNDTVRCLDTSSPNLVWTCGKMTTPRVSPIMLPMNDAAMICIIGGTQDLNNFAEFFDLQTMKPLQILATLPDNFSRDYIKAVFLPDDKKIRLFTRDAPCAMVSYDLHTKAWTQLPNPPALEVDWIPLLSHIRTINCVVVNTTLYWFSNSDNQFFAYDYVNNKFSQSTIFHVRDHSWIPSDSIPALLHLSGDTFYLVWPQLSTNFAYHCIHFTELRIFKSIDPKQLTVNVGTTHNYFIKDKGCHPQFLNAVLM